MVFLRSASVHGARAFARFPEAFCARRILSCEGHLRASIRCFGTSQESNDVRAERQEARESVSRSQADNVFELVAGTECRRWVEAEAPAVAPYGEKALILLSAGRVTLAYCGVSELFKRRNSGEGLRFTPLPESTSCGNRPVRRASP